MTNIVPGVELDGAAAGCFDYMIKRWKKWLLWKVRHTTVETLDVILELTGAPVDVRLREPVDVAVDRTCGSLSVVVVFLVDEVVRFTGGS